jgi:hypothetical protein
MLVSKIHKVGEITVVAICDPELVNRTLTGPRGIKVVAKDDFYGNQEIPPDELLKYLQNATSINALGRKSVDFLVTNGYGSQRSIIMLGEVPHLIFMRF